MKNEYLIISSILGILLLITGGCKKDDEAVKPTVTTEQVESITLTTATCGGNITADGGALVTVRGVVWSTAESPTLDSFVGITTDGEGTGSFTSNLTGLALNTTYYVRAYATNGVGTEYGSQQVFTTLNGIVVLITNSVGDITFTTAICEENITADGGASVTARGVCWSTVKNPTLDNHAGITTDGMGTGNFTSTITGLTRETLYHVRAYATNAVGTYYGEDVIFKTKSGTVTDIDGNTYYTVTIGNQVWMAENLKVTHYNNGTAIPLVTDNTAWNNLNTPGYCWCYNDETAYKDTYGALYNWYVVNTGQLAPAGWHVPTDAEWTILENYLADNGYNYDGTTGGCRCKIAKALAATTGWTTSTNEGAVGNNLNANNRSGFTAMPGGFRYYADGAFKDARYNGYWWGNTQYSSDLACNRYLSYSNAFVFSDISSKKSGFSVRCIRSY